MMQIDTQWLEREIEQFARISEQPPPVVTRVLFSKPDREARERFKRLCGEAALVLREDGAGNLFARWVGSDASLAPVATGSHIDAIPNAGKYDGVVGVLGALEAIRALRQEGFQPRRSIELILFTAEEPTLFGIGCLGSRLLSGALGIEEAEQLSDRDGKTFAQWRVEAGYGRLPLEAVCLQVGVYSAFIELHIEQGTLLERSGADIGVVEKIAGPSALRITLMGEGGHAGAVLMPDRHDALLAGAEIALAVEAAVRELGSPDTVATTGVFRIEPGAINSVPCHAVLEIDLRDTDPVPRDRVWNGIAQAVEQLCTRRGVSWVLEPIHRDLPALCDSRIVEIMEAEGSALGYRVERMISRAYHDSLFMAQLCPTSMLFIPSFRGYSHRPDEYSSPEQITMGVRVLAHSLRRLSQG